MLDFMSGFPMLGICIVFPGMILFGIRAVSHLLFKRSWDYKPMLLFGVCLILEILVVSSWTRYQTHYAIGQGEKIIRALEAYKSKAGVYPKTLDELKPTYLNDIPQAKMFSGMGPAKFFYIRSTKCSTPSCASFEEDPLQYVLFFHNFGFANTGYNSKRKTWLGTD